MPKYYEKELDKTFFLLYKQNLNNFEWKILQHFAKLKSKLESMEIVWKSGIFSLRFKKKDYILIRIKKFMPANASFTLLKKYQPIRES